MDAEVRKRMNLRIEWQERMVIADPLRASDHQQSASDFRAVLAEIDRLTQQRDTMRAALLEIDRRIREGTGAIRCTLNQFPTPATTDEWKRNIYDIAILAQIAAYFDDAANFAETTKQWKGKA